MASKPILSRFVHFGQMIEELAWQRERPDLRTLASRPAGLPALVRNSAPALRYLDLLGPLAWDRFPERNLAWQPWPVPFRALAAVCLIKLDQQISSMGRLRQFLLDNPALIWLAGFPLHLSPGRQPGFAAADSLPTARHLTRMLRELPNSACQFLLADSVRLLQAALAAHGVHLGACISGDTKHILAWVKENNPKAYVPDRFDKTKQPKGDPDCRLGCKKRHNQTGPVVAAPTPAGGQPPARTPAHNPVPAKTIQIGEFYWGYASGVIASKVPGWGEFVLAELTQPFNQPDVSYFYPLMEQTEARLGFRPPFAAFDAAFDAFYVYEYFAPPADQAPDQPQGFAAVPFSERGGHRLPFDAQGAPLCQAGHTMPLRYTFTDRSHRFEYQAGRYACPLRYPEKTGQDCPVGHKQWLKGGCTTTIPLSIGARLRYQINRDSDEYKEVYKQRTAIERINSQATELGIERPKLRNGKAIANLNTLIYVLINLRALQRIRQIETGAPDDPAQ
jgi:hypothetical protein